MKLVAAIVLALTACGGKFKAPPSVPNVAMPSGSALKPFDPAQPSLARPTGMTVFNGKAYIALANYDASFVPRGPGLLAVLDPASGALSTIDLGGSSGKDCLEPGWVRESSGKLYITCSGDFSSGAGQAVLEVDPAAAKVTRSLQAPTVPSGIAITPALIWFGDSFTGAVYAIDRASFTVVAGPTQIPCPSVGSYQTTNDVILVQGDLYAACSNNDGGLLSRLDANTGAVKMQVDSGPIAVEFTETGDGRIAIVSGGDNKLRLVTIAKTALTAAEAYTFVGTSTLQDVRARDQFLFTTASGSNTVQKLDLGKNGPQMLVGEANVGAGAVPWNIVPLDDDQALVTNQTANNVVAVSSDCSGGKVCWAKP
ncbi:MAG TPA: hypothetical protein VFE90_09065 [Myxococcales bacterium]|jgi:hypothetical protein|nr:hypothetical protein [Myxococcales bacterium]